MPPPLSIWLGNRSAKSFGLLALAVWACGCASTASLTRLQPAEHDLRGVRRVAVLPLAGPPEQAATAQQTLWSTLYGNGRFLLIGPAELALASPRPLYHPDGQIDRLAALEAAWQIRADALLLGSVRIQDNSAAGPRSGTRSAGDPNVTVSCDLEIIDVRNGAILFADRAAASQRVGPSVNGSPDPSGRTKIYEQLTRSAIATVARKITPHHVALEVELLPAMPGEGGAAIRRGNALARQGHWDQAMREWHRALADDPDNDVALYSIGLALEAQGDFRRAEQRYRDAAQQSDKALYRSAWERVQQSAQDQQLAHSQIQAPLDNPAPSFVWSPSFRRHTAADLSRSSIYLPLAERQDDLAGPARETQPFR